MTRNLAGYPRRFRLKYLCLIFFLAGIAQGAENHELTTASLIARLRAPMPEALSCPGGPETELWILAGQSNMQGMGIIDETEQPDSRIWLMTQYPEWIAAQEPLHRLWSSRMPAHRLISIMSLEQQAAAWWQDEQITPGVHRNGIGPGLPFARELKKAINKPIGLIACAHGGTSLAQWSPARKTSDTLYGAMLEQVRLARGNGQGGKLRGVLWYQGESDALAGPIAQRQDGTTETQEAYYTREFLKWIDAARRDLQEPELPIIMVQIGRFAIMQQTPAPWWEMIREAQRKIAEQGRNVWVVSALDLTMVDLIHLDTPGQRRLGKRLAEVALREVYGLKQHAAPIELESVRRETPGPSYRVEGYTIRVRFKGVNGKLQAAGRPTGFALRRSVPPGPSWIADVHDVEFDPKDPSAVLLKSSPPWREPTTLIYGPGLNPDVNIVDSKDMPIPAFGPVAIQLK